MPLDFPESPTPPATDDATATATDDAPAATAGSEASRLRRRGFLLASGAIAAGGAAAVATPAA
ncbi:hypothetical protein, partial [Streptomyces fuscigenes]|uniref:hypothetical protein n=1 Tax=Streptomyces fuscigenes TaxID=1528880 RepID=UPI001F201B1C